MRYKSSKTILLTILTLSTAGITSLYMNDTFAQGQEQRKPVTETVIDVPAGDYKLDLSHASLIFRVSHIGFSNYTMRFKKFDADLKFDPKAPETASVVVEIDANSIETDYPFTDKLDFNAELRSKNWLDTAAYPEITFKSEKIIVTGDKQADIVGTLTMHGATKPLTLKAKFNGGYRSHPYEPNARIGFSATGMLKRSDFGVAYGIPSAENPMGVSDEVEIIIEAEFSGPAMKTDTKPEPKKN